MSETSLTQAAAAPVRISVILPMLNEEAIVEAALRLVSEQLAALGESYEIVCVDDGSTDSTAEKLREASAADSRVVAVELSRNFGKEAALMAGLEASRGQAVVLMDADMQHPPDLIPEMIRKWDEGYDVVNAVKDSRGKESIAYRSMAGLFNVLMGQAARDGFRGASDFKLLDRQVVDALSSCPERARFFRGLVSWIGFREAEIPFAVQERLGGQSTWSTWQLIRYAVRNLLAFSALPLRMVAAAGLISLIFAAGLGVQTLVRYLQGEALTGFTTVILLQLLIGGLVLTCLGVLSMYVAAVYEESKQRPLFVVRKPRASNDRPPRPSAPDA